MYSLFRNTTSLSSLHHDLVQRYFHTEGNPPDLSGYLLDASEIYADCPFHRIDGSTWLNLVRHHLTSICRHDPTMGACVRDAIHHRPQGASGDNELTATFQWARTLPEIIQWFTLLIELGGDPTVRDANGRDAYDMARERFRRDVSDADEEFAMFYHECEQIRLTHTHTHSHFDFVD